MSIELKQAAQQALKELGEARKIIRASSSRQLAKDWDRRATAVLADLRTAIQQAAEGEPVAWKYQPQDGIKHPAFTEHEAIAIAHGKDGSAVPLYTHPAPGVPDGYVLVPLQVLHDASDALGNFIMDHGWGDSDMQAMDNLDAYIARHEANRAAMLSAK